MKKKKSSKKDRGLRTFLVYAFVVCVLILFSLSIKAVSLVKQSRFDGRNLNLAIAQNNKTVAIMGFNNETSKVSILKIKRSDIVLDNTAERLGIIVDAKLNSHSDFASIDTATLLTKAAVGQDSIKTDLTIFDIARLMILAKSAEDKAGEIKEIESSAKDYDINKVISSLFKNNALVSDSVSIEIVNTTEKLGLGNRLERSLSNVGAQVVSVSTARERRKQSVIKYFGNKGYTVSKLSSLLKFPVEKMKEKSIADIVILIGEDMENTVVF